MLLSHVLENVALVPYVVFIVQAALREEVFHSNRDVYDILLYGRPSLYHL